jgi:hypothetical protein
MVMVGQQAFVAHASSSGSSDSAFGTLTAAASVGQLIGPPAVTLVESLGGGGGAAPNTDLGLLICIGFSLLATPAFFFLRRTDTALRQERRLAVESRPDVGGLHRTSACGVRSPSVVPCWSPWTSCMPLFRYGPRGIFQAERYQRELGG